MQHVIGITSAHGVPVGAPTVGERARGAQRGRRGSRLTLERRSALATAAVVALADRVCVRRCTRDACRSAAACSDGLDQRLR